MFKGRHIWMGQNKGEVYQEISDYGHLDDYNTYLPRSTHSNVLAAAVQPTANSWIAAFNRRPPKAGPLCLYWGQLLLRLPAAFDIT